MFAHAASSSALPTVIESLPIVGVVVVFGGQLLSDSATMTRWRLETRARSFKPTGDIKLSDESIVAADSQVAGTWMCRHHFNRSSFTFLPHNDSQLEVNFSTSGCLGGCELARIASIDAGVIQLNSVVAEYLPRTCNRLYVIRIDGTEYLLPEEMLSDFERELNSGSDSWNWYVFRRTEEVNEQ